MQTNLADPIRHTPEGQTADEIIRRCVHCGICNAVCPTYRLSGNEADGPRGRIYQIKQLLETKHPPPATCTTTSTTASPAAPAKASAPPKSNTANWPKSAATKPNAVSKGRCGRNSNAAYCGG